MMKRIPIRAAALAALTVAVIAVAVVLLSGGASTPSHGPESIFQDDDHLLYADTPTVSRTLGVLKGLGVSRLRLTIEWTYIAPSATSTTKPVGFDATSPAAYPPGAWSRYDRIVELAGARGIGVDFNVTGPGPLWATTPTPAALQKGATPGDYEPSARAFGQFVDALGTRYSGTYIPPGAKRALPRVDYWSIWNEPNQPGWLAPQWRSAGTQRVPAAAVLYRGLLDSAVTALTATGHTSTSDTILVGETAPEGAITPVPGTNPQRYASATGAEDAVTPMVFLRALYCVNSRLQRLTGSAAAALGCPTSGSAGAFVAEHLGLFQATGFAHHPYFFFFAPNVSSPVPSYVPLANLGRLERGLDGIFATYGVKRKIPIYLTEYGYQTNPPDPYQPVTPGEQATYLNEADYMAWRNPRVRAMAQFLLYDAGPITSYPPTSRQYWSSFQTGLLYGPGTPLVNRGKPSLATYAMPIWIPHPHPHGTSKLFLWGMLRLAPRGIDENVQIQWRPAHQTSFRTIATVGVPASSVYRYFTARLTPPGPGSIRTAWRSAAGTLFTSRVVSTAARGSGAVRTQATAGNPFASVSQAYAVNHTIPPCQFSANDLALAQSSVPNDDRQYDQDFVAAIEQARQEQASGACASGRTAASAGTATAAATIPAPPASPALGQNTALRVGSPTAATDSGLPAPILILLVLGALLGAAGAALAAARMRGWDPAWAARMRHSWAEAGYRASGIWSEFDDWIRRSR
ncbi:MAG TPA: hypothetical protein VG294_01770 [Solirubrobacteraceae bacterium]|jgi:hypothetical protein|nr:hypothetical protein [Solirubrobacteraceae bacterium]